MIANYGSIRPEVPASPSDVVSSNHSVSSSQDRRLSLAWHRPFVLFLAVALLLVTMRQQDYPEDSQSIMGTSSLFSKTPANLQYSTTTATTGLMASSKKQATKSCTFTNVVCTDKSKATSLSQCYLVPSEYETCLRRIKLNPQQTHQSIQALDQVFQQYYVFYHTARNPLASRPLNPLPTGFSYYGNEPVDLHERLQEITQQQDTSVATFWKVSEVFRSLRDAHVTALPGNVGGLKSDFFSGRYAMEVIPERVWHSIQQGKKPSLLTTHVYYDRSQQLQLDIEWHSQQHHHNNNKTTSRVKMLDGLEPLEFYLRLAKSTVAGTPYKSLGPRINSLLTFQSPVTQKDYAFFWTGRRGYQREHVTPSLILPNHFDVEYMDGTSEIFHTRIVWDSMDSLGFEKMLKDEIKHDSLIIDVTGIQNKANDPSCLYRNFLAGTQKDEEYSNPTTATATATSELTEEDEFTSNNAKDTNRGRQLSKIKDLCKIDKDGWFDYSIFCSDFPDPFEEDGPLKAGYRVMDGYMLFKLDSFDAPPYLILTLWEKLTHAAKKAGIKRLMMDISQNDGGEVPAGLDLARLMYPEVSCDMFDNKYDIVYNEPMHIWATKVHPLLQEFKSGWLSSSHHHPKQELQTLLQSLTHDKLKRIVGIAKAMCILDLDHDKNYCGKIKVVKRECPLLSTAKALKRDPSIHSLHHFLQELLQYMSDSNPWTIARGYDIPISVKYESYIRGGVLANFSRFLDHEPDIPWWNCTTMPEIENPFLEYVIMSNGMSGSTSNTFQTTVEQLWKNRETSGATRPLTMVSYGGIPGDTPVTQFAGGTVNGRVNVEDPVVGFSGLHLLDVLLGNDTEHGVVVKDALALLHTSLPEVPYYFQRFPKLTAVEIYNKFLLPDAMPLEFVKLPPDVYIPQMYFGSMENPSNLEEMYALASQQFSLVDSSQVSIGV